MILKNGQDPGRMVILSGAQGPPQAGEFFRPLDNGKS
jgi:hypothetical protein